MLVLRRGIADPTADQRRRETASPTEIFRPGLLRVTVFGALLGLGSHGGYYALTTFLPTYLHTTRHLSVMSSSGHLAVFIAASFLGYLASGWLSDRIGRRRNVVLFALCCLVTLIPYLLLPLDDLGTLIAGAPLGFFFASRGYVVVTIDHTYEASEVAFPNGDLATSVFPDLLGQADLDVTDVLRTSLRTRVDDTRFVLDELGGLRHDPRLPAGLAASLDLDRIGMAGHSAGGFTAVQAMHDDPRIAAAVNLDGQLHFPGPDGHTGVVLPTVAQDGLDRPFLLMGTRNEDSGDYHHQPGWDALWQHSTGWHADVTLNDSRHGSYTDAQSLLPQLARQGAITPEQLGEDVGDGRPDRAVLATRSYVASFFDRWLRGHDDHLLDGPSPRFPEMEYAR
ncbi:MFS transporter [Kitasatospora sp. NPDC087314]|uniref:MFS transporter n=1 Tax=Kitasatospora sp. NPDC087314 TaxID=3364068 RepID=UPI0037FE72B2